MNFHAIRILFLKDLFLSRRPMFLYFVFGLCSSALACAPNPTVAFVGSLLVLTTAIGAGFHLIGSLLLGESIEQTRLFVMSLPVSLLDYSIAKIAVILTTYLIPWSAMFACSTILHFVIPESHEGAVAIIPVVFLYLLSAFTIQLVTAVVSESFGWTICIVIGCNIMLNVFLKSLFSRPEVELAAQSDVLTWPPVILQVLAIELIVIAGALALSLICQMRKRDLV